MKRSKIPLLWTDMFAQQKYLMVNAWAVIAVLLSVCGARSWPHRAWREIKKTTSGQAICLNVCVILKEHDTLHQRVCPLNVDMDAE